MNRTMTSTLAALLFTASLHADMSFGISQATLADNDPGYGFNIATEWSFYKPAQLPGASLGMVMDLGYFTLDKVKNLNDDAGYLIDLDLAGSYSFAAQGTPLQLFGAVGYGLGQIGSDAYDGLNYQAGIAYDISDRWGLGLKYIHNNADLILADTDADLDIYILYFNLKDPNKK